MWEKDKLNRKEFADFLCTLIKNSDKYRRSEGENSYVIALDSPWGTGKSYFLELFEKYISETEKQNGLRIIHYSAWENDFWDNAFLPLLYALYKEEMLSVEAQGEKAGNCVKDILRLSVYLGKEVGFKRLETVLGEDAAKMLKGGVDHMLEKPEQGIAPVFQDYEEFCRAYETIRGMLSDYQKNLEGYGKIVIVVDELDRCRPDFAVQTLEVVKHLFNVEGLVFLFAVDMEQLGCVIRGIYGEGLDARNYLNRMFHYVTHLPEPDSGLYFKVLFEEKRENFQAVYQREEQIDQAAGFVQGLADGFRLSLRELDTIWKNYMILYDYKLKNYLRIEAHLLYFLFLVMKYRYADLTAYLRRQEYSRLDEMPELEKVLDDLPEDSMLQGLFKHSVWWKLEELEGWLYGRSLGAVGSRQTRIAGVQGDTIITTGSGEKTVAIEEDTCFLGLLYAPDFVHWEQIKRLSIVEYMRKQLELFEFGGE
ncbi:MAG: hypothetical protein KH452_03215 [Clostridiales bacterium]|nr:hypothetical protein [Clostridiales bacterium]